MNEVTRILSGLQRGDGAAAGELLQLVYAELRKLAAQRLAHEAPAQTLQPTALVHEAYLRLVDVDLPPQWNGRGHVFAAAAEAMRRILVENARHKNSLKAGGQWQRIDVAGIDLAADENGSALDVLALDDALAKLERDEPRKAEVVKLRFFGGLTNDQAAEVLGISGATAENDWAYARAWLRLQLDGDHSSRATLDQGE
jgi:RNA polymerase sigma factor (TIGR02999 family)